MANNGSRYTKHMHILVTEAMHNFVKNDLNGGIGHHIRQMILAYMGNFDKDLAELKKRFAVVEPEYLSLKKRIEEAEAEKKRIEDEKAAKEKRIEDARAKLLVSLKERHYRVEDVPLSVLRFYSDQCGLSVSDLKAWLAEEAKKKE